MGPGPPSLGAESTAGPLGKSLSSSLLFGFRYCSCGCSGPFDTQSFARIFSLCALCSVAQLCLTLWDCIDYRQPGSSVCGIFLARTLEWVAMSSASFLSGSLYIFFKNLYSEIPPGRLRQLLPSGTSCLSVPRSEFE